MPANVTVHYKAQSDHRIVFLAKLLGVTVDDAFGKMVRLWGLMTEKQTDMPDVDHINAIMLDLRGAELLVKSTLAEQIEDGVVRVKGRVDNDTGRDRLDWYGGILDRNAKAGQARAANAVRDSRGRMTSGIAPASAPASDQPVQPPPASDLRSDPSLSSSGSSSSGADPRGDHDREATEAELAEAEGLVLPPNPPLRNVNRSPELPHTDDLVSTSKHVMEAKAVGGRIWKRLETLRNEIAAELGATIRPLHPFDAGTRALQMRIREASLTLDAERIEADLNHVLDVVAAEARATKSVQWLTGGVFEERAFRRALGMTIEDAVKRSISASPSRPPKPPEPPPRKLRTL